MASILRWANIIGACAFLIGFVGPVIFSDNNLGPLLGLFVTGPLGYLLGGVIGFWLLLRVPKRIMTSVEWGGLVVIWLLTMAWYYIFCEYGPFTIQAVVGIQLLIVFGTIFFYVLCINAKPSSNIFILIVLSSTLFIVGAEIFPPVTRPDWGVPSNGFYGTVPTATLYNDSRLVPSKDVPQLAINRKVLSSIWLVVISINGIAWILRWMITKQNSSMGY